MATLITLNGKCWLSTDVSAVGTETLLEVLVLMDLLVPLAILVHWLFTCNGGYCFVFIS